LLLAFGAIPCAQTSALIGFIPWKDSDDGRAIVTEIDSYERKLELVIAANEIIEFLL
jgi:hypothetical protein